MADDRPQTWHEIAERAIRYAGEISFPRLVGTEGEKKAQAYLMEKTTSWGWEVREEELVYRSDLESLLKLGIGVVLLADTPLILPPLAVPPWLEQTVAGLILSALFFFPHILRRALEWAAGDLGSDRRLDLPPSSSRAKRSTNIVAELSSPTPPPPRSSAPPHPHLVMLAHYDSKSQTLPLLVRMMAFLVFGISSLVLALGHLPVLTFLSEHSSLAYLSALSSGLLLLVNRTDNRSQGGLDNAASVGLLLALAEELAARRTHGGASVGPASRLRLTLVFTGAEEMGLSGAYAFLARHRSILKEEKERLYLLNLDGTGASGPLVLFGQRDRWSRPAGKANRMLSAVGRAAQAEGVSLWRLTFPWPGMLADHLPFVQRGYAAITLSSYSAATWTIHTDRDTPEGIDPEGVAKAAAFIWRTIHFIEQES